MEYKTRDETQDIDLGSIDPRASNSPRVCFLLSIIPRNRLISSKNISRGHFSSIIPQGIKCASVIFFFPGRRFPRVGTAVAQNCRRNIRVTVAFPVFPALPCRRSAGSEAWQGNELLLSTPSAFNRKLQRLHTSRGGERTIGQLEVVACATIGRQSPCVHAQGEPPCCIEVAVCWPRALHSRETSEQERETERGGGGRGRARARTLCGGRKREHAGGWRMREKEGDRER